MNAPINSGMGLILGFGWWLGVRVGAFPGGVRINASLGTRRGRSRPAGTGRGIRWRPAGTKTYILSSDHHDPVNAARGGRENL